MILTAAIVAGIIWAKEQPIYPHMVDECKNMDLTATFQYLRGEITKEQAEADSKQRGWKQ